MRTPTIRHPSYSNSQMGDGVSLTLSVGTNTRGLQTKLYWDRFGWWRTGRDACPARWIQVVQVIRQCQASIHNLLSVVILGCLRHGLLSLLST